MWTISSLYLTGWVSLLFDDPQSPIFAQPSWLQSRKLKEYEWRESGTFSSGYKNRWKITPKIADSKEWRNLKIKNEFQIANKTINENTVESPLGGSVSSREVSG